MEKEKKVKQTIVIRKDLNMPIGKAISQGCHASLGCVLGQMSHELTRIGNPDGPDVRNTHKLSYMEGDYWDKWLNGIFTKITVGCENEK